MNTGVSFERVHLAPCGINCGTCRAYLRDRNKCSGCMSGEGSKVGHCYSCSIRNCESLEKTTSKFCYDCNSFPCRRISQIDKRYRTKYRISLLKNLRTLQENGMETYIRSENDRWTCSNCGSVLCVHLSKCMKCETVY